MAGTRTSRISAALFLLRLSRISVTSSREAWAQHRTPYRGDLVKLVLLFASLVLASACAGPQAGRSDEADASADSASPGTTPAPPDATVLPPAPAATASPTVDGPAMVVALQEPRLLEALTSPNGAWRAEVIAYDCVAVSPEETLAYQELRLVDTESASSRLADSQLQTCGGLGAAGLSIRFWSENSRFLYYTDAASGVPDGCGFWLPPYLRLDTADQAVEYLGEGVLSPDGAMLAAWQGDKLGVWRIDGDGLGLVETPGRLNIPGPIAWRPDGSAVAFLISEDYCPLGDTALARIDIPEMRPVVVVTRHKPGFSLGLRWDEPNRITLTDENGGMWRYDFVTGELSQVEP